MIKFFRKIRQRLLSENKFSKYLIYAIGEVLLVVIGILIALQINNWNENKKQIKKEEKLLQQFKNELNEDLFILNEITTSNKFVIKSCNELIKHLENNMPYNDSLSLYFDRWASPNVLEFNGSTYQNLTTTGPELIRNEHLRKSILKLYNFTYKKAKTYNDYFRGDFHSFIAPIQLQNVEAVEWGKSSIPLDYESLKKNVLFINALKWSKNGHQSNNKEFSKLRETITVILEMIDTELNSKRFD
jgi:hypothetical protein|tara:strand:- start:653 stop:1384 length:732 start_codon:yes stop_codon:yes gene_type:complete